MKEQPKSLYGLVGYPVAHSLSPLMHNTAFKALKVNAEYCLFPLKEEELKDFFTKLHDKKSFIFGLNVTVPYKEKVIPYMDTLSPYAEKTGAINTVVIDKLRKLRGFNTDGLGFLTHLTELGFNVKDKRIAMIGCGGVARAMISVLCLLSERPASFRVFDIDQKKAENLLVDLEKRLDVSMVSVVHSIEDLNIELADLLINATPVGMKESDPVLIGDEAFHRDMLVYDVIYNPAETKLLKAAKAEGAKTSNGLDMLFYQGVLAFQHWAEIELDQTIKDKMKKSLLKGVKTI